MRPRTSSYASILFFVGSTHFLIHVLSQLLPAVLPVIRRELSLGLTQASFLVSIPFLVQVAAYIPAGVASDRKSTLVLASGFALTAVGAVVIPSASSYGFIMLGFGFLALGQTLYHPPALKATSETEPKKLGLAMGIQMAGGSLGFSAGPILLGLILPLWGWRVAFYIWAPIILLAAIYSYIFMRRITRSQSKDEAQASLSKMSRSLFNRGFLIMVLIGAIAEAASIIVLTYLTSYLTDVRGISAALASIVFGIGPLVGIIGCLLGGVTADRFGRYRSTILVMGAMAVTMALIPVWGSLILVALFYILWRGFYSASMPLMNALVVSHSESETRSLAFSVAFLVSNLADAVAPVATSIVIEGRIGAIFPISVLTLLPGIALALYLRTLDKEGDAIAGV